MTNYGSFSLGGNSSETIQPGIYSQISVSGNAKLTMSGGIYIIEGGGFSVSGNASVTGSGVMIVNAGSNYPGTGGTYGSITLGGNGTCNLSPATSGTYAGIVFFQPADNTKALTVTGNASGITGTIYAPAAPLSESGNAVLNASLIVDTLTISGNGIADSPGTRSDHDRRRPDVGRRQVRHRLGLEQPGRQRRLGGADRRDRRQHRRSRHERDRVDVQPDQAEHERHPIPIRIKVIEAIWATASARRACRWCPCRRSDRTGISCRRLRRGTRSRATCSRSTQPRRTTRSS